MTIGISNMELHSYDFNQELGEILTSEKLVQSIRNGESKNHIRTLLDAGVLANANILRALLSSVHFYHFPTLLSYGLDIPIEYQKEILLKSSQEGYLPGLEYLFISSGKEEKGQEKKEKITEKEALDINVKDKDGITALMWASSGGHLSVVEYLCSIPDIDINARSEMGFTALMYASSNGHLPIVEYLCNLSDIEINARNKYGITGLIWASTYGHLSVVEYLCNIPCIDFNARANDGATALIKACYMGNLEVVKILLNLPGIDINDAKDSDGTALDNALKGGDHLSVAALLRAHGAK